MDRLELIAILQTLRHGDPVEVHALAEGLLLGFMVKEGYSDVVMAYRKFLTEITA